MRNTILAAFLLAAATIGAAFMPATPTAEPAAIQWHTWDEAMALNAKQPKKIFVDVYTDWCGWCKRMDATTFRDSALVQYMNEHYYAVKLDAEQRQDVVFADHTFKYMDGGTGRGVHELAYSLLDGNLGYPAFVFLTEKMERVRISPGYKPAPDMLKEMRFVAEQHYAKETLEQYLAH